MKPSARLERARENIPAASPRPRPAVPPIPGFTPRSEDVYAHYLRRIAPERLVMGAGLLSLAIYVGFILAFPITFWWNQPHAGPDPTDINDMGRITGYSPVAAILYISAMLALFGCQFMALTGVARVKQDVPATQVDRLVRRCILLFPLAFAVVMVWMQPVTTTDLYGYVARGYLYAQLHHNPMTTPAVLLPGGLQVNRPAAPYGPAWLLIAALVSRLCGGSLLANLLVFKVIALGFVAGAIVLVDWLAHELYPQRRLRIDVLFAWSPLLIFESIGNGHNDIVMVVCVLGALALMLKGRARTAFALLVLGALVKYFSAVFVALWLVYELRHRTRVVLEPDRAGGQTPLQRLLGGVTRAVSEVDRKAALNLVVSAALIGLALVVTFYAPFWAGFKTFTGLSQQLQPLYYNGSIVGFIAAPLALLVPTHAEQAALDKVVRLVCYALFGIYMVIQVRRLWVRGGESTVRDIITAAAKLTFAALLLITFWYQPWYVAWLLPLAALAGEPFVRRQGTILALGSLLTYAIASFVLIDETGVGRDLFVQFFEILVAFGPLLLLRTASYDQGWRSIARRYLGLVGAGFREQSILLERVMLVLIVMVAAILRLVRLGNLFVEAPSGPAAEVLKQASGDLRLFLSDPQGLHGPFVAIEGLLVAVFGRTSFAALLPSAILGSLTVLMIYVLTVEIMSPPGGPKKRAVALLASLLAATSAWHVSLSRSGMEVVLLPLLLCVAVYLTLLALRTGIPQPMPPARPRPPVQTQPRHRSPRSRRSMPIPRDPQAVRPNPSRQRRRILLFVGSGLATGLACDVAPGLWLVPLVVVGVLILWRWHQRQQAAPRLWLQSIGALVISTLVAGIPVIWYYASRAIGFPVGNAVLAHSSVTPRPGPSVVSLAFWGQVASNAADVLRLLAVQDYSAGYPAVGGTPIIPTLLGPFFYLGLLIIVARWREFSSLALLLLVALPLVASIAVGTPTGVIEAASVLPAMCIIPAYAMYEAASWLGHLPIVLDRTNGGRVFSTPEQIGRVLLFVFLLISALRTFYWYFEVTLPASGPNQFVPSLVPSHIVQAHPGASGDRSITLASHSTDGSSAYLLVQADERT